MTELFRGKRLWVEKEEFLLPNGRKKEGVVIHPGDAVVILPFEAGECLLLRQYRFAVGEWILEAPAGTMNEGETPGECARRELIEETGFHATTLVPRGAIMTTPGFTDERLFLFEARDLFPSDEFQPDDDEVIETLRVPVPEVREMILDGRISDAKTICVFYRCVRP
jgi:ADP-ribose pyrophosphatase